MNSYPVREKWRNFFSVVAGVLVAFLINTGVSIGTSHNLLTLIPNDPTQHAIMLENAYRADAWTEIGALIVGFFAGGLVASLISTRRDIVHALLVPPIALFFIWHSSIGMELVVLALPLWMFVALIAYKLSCWIKWKRKRKIPT